MHDIVHSKFELNARFRAFEIETNTRSRVFEIRINARNSNTRNCAFILVRERGEGKEKEEGEGERGEGERGKGEGGEG